VIVEIITYRKEHLMDCGTARYLIGDFRRRNLRRLLLRSA